MHILPSVKSKAAGATEKGDNVATGSVVERPIKKAKARKPPTKKASAMCPAELKDHHQSDENNENICWTFNLKGGCKEKASNHKLQERRSQVRQLPSHWTWPCNLQDSS